jgi:hypothetical protein
MKELLEHLNKIYVEQLSNCSEICRKIVFTLYVVTWGLAYTKDGFEMNKFFLVVFLILTIYLVLDALQYFLTALRYRKHFYKIEEAYHKGESEENIYRLEKDKRKTINDKSFFLLKWKLSLLPFAFFVLIIGIIEKLSITFANNV